MRITLKISLLTAGYLVGVPFAAAPAGAQSMSHGISQGKPTPQQIEQFCANWGQFSDSERKQYQEQYEQHCRRPAVQPESTIMRPPDPQLPQPQPQKPQQPGKPRKPLASEEPEPAPPELETRPARPQPEIPAPGPLQVDLVGRLALVGEPVRQPGEPQRLRVTVANRGADAPAGNRLWARVFLSDTEVSRRGASAGAFSLSGTRRGQPVRLPGVPGPGRSREVMAAVPLPVSLADGNYWWCVQMDSRQEVAETDESNNVACARRIVAVGGDSDPKLSGVFGSKAARLKQQQDRIGMVTGQEQDIQPLSGDPPPSPAPLAARGPVETVAEPELRVNGQTGEVWVRPGDSATASWNLNIPPAGGSGPRYDRFYLIVSAYPAHGLIPGGGCFEPSYSVDRPGYGARHPDEGYKDDIPAGSQDLSLDTPDYLADARYHLVGCLFESSSGRTRPTNTVSLYYMTPPGHWARDIDLSVAYAYDTPAGLPAEGRLPRRLTFEVRNPGPLPDRSDLPAGFGYRIYLNRDDLPAASGVAGLGLNDAAYSLPDDGRMHLVRVEINGDHSFPERRYSNNSFSVAVQPRLESLDERNHELGSIDIGGLSLIEEGPGWALLEVSAKSPGSVHGRVPVPVLSMYVRRTHNPYRGFGYSIECAGANDTRLVPLPVATGRYGRDYTGVRFLCRFFASGGASEIETRWVTVTFRHASQRLIKTWPLRKRWEAYSLPALPRLELEEVSIELAREATEGSGGSCGGGGGLLTARIRNTGDRRAPASTTNLQLIWDRDDYLADYCHSPAGGWATEWEVPVLDPEQAHTVRLTVPDSVSFGPRDRLRIVMDAEDDVFGSNAVYMYGVTEGSITGGHDRPVWHTHNPGGEL